jgi:hypothetical protein
MQFSSVSIKFISILVFSLNIELFSATKIMLNLLQYVFSLLSMPTEFLRKFSTLHVCTNAILFTNSPFLELPFLDYLDTIIIQI